jgi:hypothetical protein
MNRALASAVVDLIRDPSVDTSERLRKFTARDWRRTNHWLITSGLAMYLFVGLRKLGAESVLHAEQLWHLASLYDASALRTAELRRDLLALNQRFSELGVPFANWKGFALEPDFCPDIRLRPQMDFDFVAMPADKALFHRAMLDAGYELTEINGAEQQYELLPGQNYSLEDVYRPKPHRKVELHFGVDSHPRFCEVMDFESALKRRRDVATESTPFPTLAPEDAFLSHAAHAGKHALMGWVRLAWLLELDTFIERNRHNLDLWHRVRRIGNAMSIAGIGVALALTSRVWQRALPAQLCWATQALPRPLDKWLDEHGLSFTLTDFPGTKLHLFMNRELLSGPEWRIFERVTLFPLKKPSQVAYALPKASFRRKWRASRNQMRFVLRRLKFHAIEDARYLLMKWRSLRSPMSLPSR